MIRRQSTDASPAEFYEVYSGYSKSLTGWLIAYGVGFVVLLITNESLLRMVIQSKAALTVVLTFIGGVLCQVILVLLNKYVMWLNYQRLNDGVDKKTKFQECYIVLSKQIWIDVMLDALSVTLYVTGTILIIRANIVNL